MSKRMRTEFAVFGAVLVAGLGVVLPTYIAHQHDTVAPQPAASTNSSSLQGPGLAANPVGLSSVLEARARAGLKEALPPQAPVTFAPLTAGLKRLKALDVASAESAYIEFGTREEGRTWRVYVAPAIDKSLTCPEPLPATLLMCSVDETASGQVRTSVMATRKASELGPNDYMLIQSKDELNSTALSDLRLELNVRNYWVDGSETSVSETVYAPTTLDPKEAFTANASDLSGLVTDSALRWGTKS